LENKTTATDSIATGRTTSLFAADLLGREQALRATLRGKRVLAIGGAGSIGSSTVSRLADLQPEALHVVDQNENDLAELVRQLRSRPEPTEVADFRTLPLDFGSAGFRFFLADQKPYDFVLNFAALKHVRTEKDPYSTLQMFETNLLKQARLMAALAKSGFEGRFFTVSTDKAANPSSMMGASKRAMEHVMFNSGTARQLKGIKTSARFANVAFSNGSLLQSFERRLARGEPLAAPAQTRRYFVSIKEAGEICTLASLWAPDQGIVVPRLDPEEHLVDMQDIAERFLRHHGYEPALYEDEEEACGSVALERNRKRWPLLVTRLDTAGEKPYEEFVAKGEQVVDIGLSSLQAVKYLPAPSEAIDEMLAELESIIDADHVEITKDRLKLLLAKVEPAFLTSHRDSQLNLDQRV
jgi:FlaA1/EpsC-like NDP-sugar epimerase